jgi:hypothetical protein
MLLLLLRRLSPRNRALAGLAVLAAGIALIPTLSVVHGVVLALIGAALCTSGVAAMRRATR